jgi:hypothetical protein
MPRHGPRLLSAAALLFLAASTGLTTPSLRGAAEQPSPIASRAAKPRFRLAKGDRWRVRVSQYQMQLPEPDWTPPDTWLFTVPGLEKTKEGWRLIVTATREGAPKPTIRMELDPDTQTALRIEVTTPVSGGERPLVERPVPGEPFISELSPVPLAFSGRALPGTLEGAAGNPPPNEERSLAVGTAQHSVAFTFGSRLEQRSEPVDAGVGRARIEQGLSGLSLTRRAGLEPAGVPRYSTIIEGPGLRVEQIWDETTPWPLFTQTDTSRSWLVTFAKGKS